MKKIYLGVLFLSMFVSQTMWAQWKPVGDKIKTDWAEKIDPSNVWPDYPRPLLERNEWANLNGLWEYAITPLTAAVPAQFDGQILVPFAVESSLSGVGKMVGKEKNLWYKRTFDVPAKWKNKRVMLNFGAVDWLAEVFVNDVKVGQHQGGYTPFSFDITPYLNKAGKQTLVVKVWDPTDDGFQPRGKQVKRPDGIWYTPVTGIWQTVWMEPVAESHIKAIKATPDIDAHLVKLSVCASAIQGDYIEAKVFDGGKVIATSKAVPGNDFSIAMPANAKLWTPESPNLYDMTVSIVRSGVVVDEVKSYVAMRKISFKQDAAGINRMQLNNKDYFHFGPLDQGWWPDGLYTAPSSEALAYDIKKTKDWGFNMLRKHVKVEPALFYTLCDRMGILVWQDMPNGDKSPRWEMYEYSTEDTQKRSIESEQNFRQEWKEIMDLCYSNPSVVVWVPFNEAWGQFKTAEIVEWTKFYDPSRLVNPASGGNHYRVGDILDLHKYPGPEMYLVDAKRVTVLGEYGGIGLPLKDHLWQSDKNWGYVQYKSEKEVTDEYVNFARQLEVLVKRGFSAAVYTQTTDVEGEVNGLMTYDRKKIKIIESEVREANQRVINIVNK